VEVSVGGCGWSGSWCWWFCCVGITSAWRHLEDNFHLALIHLVMRTKGTESYQKRTPCGRVVFPSWFTRVKVSVVPREMYFFSRYSENIYSIKFRAKDCKDVGTLLKETFRLGRFPRLYFLVGNPEIEENIGIKNIIFKQSQNWPETNKKEKNSRK